MKKLFPMIICSLLILVGAFSVSAEDIIIDGNTDGPEVFVEWYYSPGEVIENVHREIKVVWTKEDGQITYQKGFVENHWDKTQFKWVATQNDPEMIDYQPPALAVEVTNMSSPDNDYQVSLSIGTDQFSEIWDEGGAPTPIAQAATFESVLTSNIGPDGRTFADAFDFAFDFDKVESKISAAIEADSDITTKTFDFSSTLNISRADNQG
jgi:hypothetical protein